jgi:hypothetical protein
MNIIFGQELKEDLARIKEINDFALELSAFFYRSIFPKIV